ncbi:MAG: hypothetical protein FVQ81_10685 [Candidatus Glassbacteria bacterium]|nr:hypothetical protein [Candidatus Glassbacteria bacterium]
MQIKGQFVHLDESCPVFKYLQEGESCFYKSSCDAICDLADGGQKFKKMRDELDFRAFPEVWKKREMVILANVAKVIRRLEEKKNFLDAKRMKQAYGFDTAKRMAAKKSS